MADLDNSGDVVHVQGSGSKPYELKNVEGVLSCSCPAWRNFGGPIDRRTCKHLKKVRGEASEAARIGGTLSSVGTDTGRVQTATENKSVSPRSDSAGTQAAANLSAGKKLRQDEKAKLFGPPIMHAHSIEDFPDLNPAGWWYSEKLDGVRAYWDGENFVSRYGNIYPAPNWFKAGLPEFPLDGELWMGRKMLQKTVSVVKSAGSGERWRDVVFRVFDAPAHPGAFEDRMRSIVALEEKSAWKHAIVLLHFMVRDRPHLLQVLSNLCEEGAEGVMIRKPGSAYEVGRSSTILKVKPFKDAEAIVVSHVAGKGRLKGMLGGLEVRLPDGKTFNVGTGLTDAERRSPPKVGSTITYRYTELTDDGIPKCASFVAVRDYE